MSPKKILALKIFWSGKILGLKIFWVLLSKIDFDVLPVVLVILVTWVIQTPNPLNSANSPWMVYVYTSLWHIFVRVSSSSCCFCCDSLEFDNIFRSQYIGLQFISNLIVSVHFQYSMLIYVFAVFNEANFYRVYLNSEIVIIIFSFFLSPQNFIFLNVVIIIFWKKK